MRTTQRKGDTASSQALATFTRLGFDVSVPFTESAAYDLIVDVDDNLYRVQVRFCGASNREVGLRRIHSNAQGYVVKKMADNSYDWLYVLHADGGEYLIPSCLAGRTSVTLTERMRIGEQLVLKTSASKGVEGSIPSLSAL